MSLKDRINEDLKTFMRAKDIYALEAVRMLKADIKNAEIEAHKELNDDEILTIVCSGIKKHKEAAEISAKAGREDLLAKENRYNEILEAYLPKQLSKDEIKKVVHEVIAELGNVDPKADFGAVVKAVIAKVGFSANGKLVSAAVKEVLQ
jgi:uncharacterized protein YqeY